MHDFTLPAHVHACKLLSNCLGKIMTHPACSQGRQVVRNAEDVLVQRCMRSATMAKDLSTVLAALARAS